MHDSMVGTEALTFFDCVKSLEIFVKIHITKRRAKLSWVYSLRGKVYALTVKMLSRTKV